MIFIVPVSPDQANRRLAFQSLFHKMSLQAPHLLLSVRSAQITSENSKKTK